MYVLKLIADTQALELGKSSNGLGFMAVQSSSQKLSKNKDHRRKKVIVNLVLNFRKVTHFWLCLLETQVLHVPASAPAIAPTKHLPLHLPLHLNLRLPLPLKVHLVAFAFLLSTPKYKISQSVIYHFNTLAAAGCLSGNCFTSKQQEEPKRLLASYTSLC